jgi:RNA polymerase sigma-70 factor (ECF subfamily)
MASINKPINNFFAGNFPFGLSFGSADAAIAGDTAGMRAAYEGSSDADLIGEFLSGKGEAFAVLLDRHVSMTYKFVYRYVGNADDASDIVQDAFIKVWKNIQKFDRSKNFKTWLLAIAKNTALDFIKRKKPMLFSAIEAGDRDIDTFLAPYMESPALPDELMEQKYKKAELDSAFQTINLAYQTVLRLRYGEHLKFREIAESLGEPIDTIKSKHRRGLIALRAVLSKQPQ